MQSFGIDPHSDAEHKLVTLRLGFYHLRCELCLGSDEDHLGGDRVIGIRIQHDARIGANLDAARLQRRKINVHVDI